MTFIITHNPNFQSPLPSGGLGWAFARALICAFAFALPLHATPIESLITSYGNAKKSERVAIANQFFAELDKQQFTDEPIRFTDKSNPDSVDMNVWFWAGEWAMDAADYDRAAERLQRATDILHDGDDRESESDCLNELAICWFKKGDFAKAIRYAKACYQMTEQLGDDERLSYTLNTITGIYIAAKQPREARKYNQRAILLAEKTGDKALIANRLGMASEISHLEGYEQEAYDQARRAYDLHISLGDTAKAAVRQVQMATALIELHRYDEAKQHMLSAMPVLKANQNILSLGICYNQMGDVLLNEHQPAEAQDYFRKALDIFQNIGNQYHESHSAFGLYQSLRDSDPKAALLHLDRYAALKDSLYQHDMQHLLANADAEYDNDTLTQANADAHKHNRQLLLFGLAILAIVLAAVAFLLYALRLKSRAAQLNLNLQEARERFFTNITHEFRTPLAVINAATEELQKQIEECPLQTSAEGGKKHLRHIDNITRSSQSLLNLINQILDIAKLRSINEDKKHNSNFLPNFLSNFALPSLREGQGVGFRTDDVVPFISMMCESYHDYAAQQGITLAYASKEPSIRMDYIPDYLRKILRNLISNAIKFSGDGNQVFVHTETIGNSLQIIVRDEGIGIAPDQLDQIFEPFYQAANDSRNIGTGVGLSLARLATEAMDGTIEVHSAPGEGSIFIVTLPLRHGKGNWQQADATENAIEKVDLPSKNADFIDADAEEDAVRILIVEDVPEVAEYMAQNLNNDYNIFFAGNGREGLEKARALVPDIIVTDIMMPEMDGYELCRNIRHDDLLCHIPVIMVTAKVTKEDRMRGLEAGADAWLEKPFHSDELNLRMKKLLEQRQLLRERFAPSNPSAPSASTRQSLIEESQRAFAEKVEALVEEQMNNHKIDLEEVASELCITRVQLSRKVKAITGMSSRDYVNTLRISKAKRLLDNSGLNISEIAMKCGIEDVAYFSRFFRKLTGLTPTEYQNRAKN